MNLNDIHPIQAQILCKLLYSQEASFAKINIHKTPTDQFSFHLRQLQNLKLIEKQGNGNYVLTTSGKEYANRFDEVNKELEKQAKIGVLIVATKIVNDKKYYLLQHRLKQPYFGFWGFVTGKLRWGETLEEGAARELREETGLSGKIELKAVKHKMDYLKDEAAQEDKFFFLHKASELQGELTEQFDGGVNKWLTREEIGKLSDVFDGVIENLDIIEEGNLIFVENKYKVSKY